MPLTNRPRRIVLVRHGESQGNVDDSIYETVPDHALTSDPQGGRAGDRGGEATSRIPRGRAAHPLRVAVRPHPADRRGSGPRCPRRGRADRAEAAGAGLGELPGPGRHRGAEAASQRVRPLLLPVHARRVRLRRLRPGEHLPRVALAVHRGRTRRRRRPPDVRPEPRHRHARTDHAAVLHALVPLERRVLRVAGEPGQRRPCRPGAAARSQVPAARRRSSSGTRTTCRPSASDPPGSSPFPGQGGQHE